jgi:hypothetical protein
VFVRLGELVREGRAPDATPRALLDAAKGERVSLGDYMALDDIEILSALSRWEHAADPMLADLARRLRARELPKTLPLPQELREPLPGAAGARVASSRRSGACAPSCTSSSTTPATCPTRSPTTTPRPASGCCCATATIMRLGDASFLLKELRNKRLTSSRLIFPSELRTDIEATLGPLLDEFA